MTFDQLRYFIVIAQNKNMTRAAEELNVVQPALSRAMQRLEKELGIDLFLRIGKSMQLTKDGEAFLQFATQCTNNFSRLQKDFLREPLQGSLYIGNMLENEKVNTSIVEFSKLHDYVDMEVSSAHRIEQNDNYNFFFGTEFYENNYLKGTFNSTPLYTEEMTLVVSKDHPLAQCESVKLSEVAVDYPFLLPKKTEYSTFIDKFLLMASCNPTSKFRTNDMTIHAAVIANTNCVAITPAYSIIHGTPENYRHIRIKEPEYRRQISLFWKAGKILTPLEEEFIEFVKNYFKEHPYNNEIN